MNVEVQLQYRTGFSESYCLKTLRIKEIFGHIEEIQILTFLFENTFSLQLSRPNSNSTVDRRPQKLKLIKLKGFGSCFQTQLQFINML